MTQEMRSKGSRLATIVKGAAGLFICLALLAIPGYGQGLAGRWAAQGRTLDNGEQQKSILELKQDGNELSGKLKTLGFSVDVKGTATGNHFELYVTEWEQNKPILVGDLVDGELHVVEGPSQSDRQARRPGRRHSRRALYRAAGAAQCAV